MCKALINGCSSAFKSDIVENVTFMFKEFMNMCAVWYVVLDDASDRLLKAIGFKQISYLVTGTFVNC